MSRQQQLFTLLVLATTPVASNKLQAQACFGTPSRTNVAYEYGMLSFGQSNGVSAALVGGRTALGLALRTGEIDDLDMQGADLRFSLKVPAGRVQICPALGVGYKSLTSEPATDFKINSKTLSLRAGAGVGIEQEVYAGISLIPFVAARYEFSLVYIDVDAPNADPDDEISGDTLSRVDFEYGLTATWRMLYVGIAAQRNSDSGSRPYFARYILGFTFGSGSSTRK